MNFTLTLRKLLLHTQQNIGWKISFLGDPKLVGINILFVPITDLPGLAILASAEDLASQRPNYLDL